MASKRTKSVEQSKDQPRFDSNTMVHIRSFVVDKNGTSWWIDPEAKTIELVISGE